MAWKITPRTWVLFAVLLLLIGGTFTAKKELDVCKYTTQSRIRLSVFGLTYRQEIRPSGLSVWLEDEFGITGPNQYVDVIDINPLFESLESVEIPPSGNWVPLRELYYRYEEAPEVRPKIRAFLENQYSTEDPSITYYTLLEHFDPEQWAQVKQIIHGAKDH